MAQQFAESHVVDTQVSHCYLLPFNFQVLASVIEPIAIDACAYAVMSKHYHLVLFVNQDELNSRPDEELMDCWGSLFPASTLKIKNLFKSTDNVATWALHQERK